jgi:hypothetical protein
MYNTCRPQAFIRFAVHSEIEESEILINEGNKQIHKSVNSLGRGKLYSIVTKNK